MSVALTLAHGRLARSIANRLPPWWRLRGALLVGALTLATAALAASLWTLVSIWRDNRTIAGLKTGQDLPVSAAARPEAVLARAHFLLQQGRMDEAQTLVSAAKAGSDVHLLAKLHYNLANARLRSALSLLEQDRIDPAIPLVRLAKDGYRAALAIDPGSWDARHNLDVAMRLVRDFPQIERSMEEPPQRPKPLWTDLPGAPKGLP